MNFLSAFGGARAITHAIQHRIGPFHYLSVGGRHLHHLVFGIGGLLTVGYLWLVLVGTEGHPAAASRATPALYGVGSALTLDEFALWLNLQDVYWAKQGRKSIDAVAVFGGLLSIGVATSASRTSSLSFSTPSTWRSSTAYALGLKHLAEAPLMAVAAGR